MLGLRLVLRGHDKASGAPEATAALMRAVRDDRALVGFLRVFMPLCQIESRGMAPEVQEGAG